jgi:hypothetical protein
MGQHDPLGKKVSKESVSKPHLDYVKPSFTTLALWFPMAALALSDRRSLHRFPVQAGVGCGMVDSCGQNTFNLQDSAKSYDWAPGALPDSTDYTLAQLMLLLAKGNLDDSERLNRSRFWMADHTLRRRCAQIRAVT